MAGTLKRGYSFGATEEVTAAKLHALIDDGTISGITADDIASGTITDDKISSVSGSKLTGLANIPSGSGVIPAANLTSVAQKGANSDITSLTGLTTPLSTAQGGTGSSANANTANGVVKLDSSAKLPAVDGSQLTGVASLGSWASKSINTVYQAATDGFLVGALNVRTGSVGYVYSDSSNPPTTARVSTNMWDGGALVPFCVPIKKDDYYKVVDPSSPIYTTYIYWIPIGS